MFWPWGKGISEKRDWKKERVQGRECFYLAEGVEGGEGQGE